MEAAVAATRVAERRVAADLGMEAPKGLGAATQEEPREVVPAAWAELAAVPAAVAV